LGVTNPYHLLDSNEASKIVICDPITGKIYKGSEIKKGAPENPKDPSIVCEFDLSKAVYFVYKSGRRTGDSEIDMDIKNLGLSEEEIKRLNDAKKNYFNETETQSKIKGSPYNTYNNG
jgi:hypothetical protein